MLAQNKHMRLVFLLLILALTAPALVNPAQAAPPGMTARAARQAQAIWFDDITQPLISTEQDKAALMRYAAASLLQRRTDLPGFPAAFQGDELPRIVFLSLSDGTERAHVVWGAGLGVAQALEQALLRAYALLDETYEPLWIKLDVVQRVIATEDVDVAQPLEWERSLYGLAFAEGSGLAFLPGELMAATLVNSDQQLQMDHITVYLLPRPEQSRAFIDLRNAEQVRLHRFTTSSFFWADNQVSQLYRGHRVSNAITEGNLMMAARRGGTYLTEAVRESGQFVYVYWPKTDRVPDDYNIVRHAGTIYAMMELVEITDDPALLAAARRAISYLVQQIESCTTPDGPRPCVVEDGYTKLGGNALAAVALAKYIEVTGEQYYRSLLIDLGHWIQSAQAPSGEFLIHKQSYPEGEDTGFVSAYYPGEALLALTRIYQLDPRSSWLDSAEAGAQWLITVRDSGLTDEQLPHDHWLLYALNELYRLRSNQLYLQHAMRIAGTIVDSQNLQPIYPDWYGSFYEPPRSAPTATRMEGLCSAYMLADDFGSPQEAAVILDALNLGIKFQLQTQFEPASALYLRDPQRVLGGFRRSLTNYEIRIDYVQHNISSLLCMQRVLSGQSDETGAETSPLLLPLLMRR